MNASGIRLINNATKVIQVTMHNEIDGARRGMNSRNYNQSRILSNKFCKNFSNFYCLWRYHRNSFKKETRCRMDTKRYFVSCELFSNMNSITSSFQLHGNSWQLTTYCRDICYTIHLSPCILLSQLMDFEWTSYPSSKLLEMKYISILEMWWFKPELVAYFPIDLQNRLNSSLHAILHWKFSNHFLQILVEKNCC